MAASLGAWLRGPVCAAVGRRGLAARGLAGPGGREPDPDSDWEPEERELQELASALARRRRAARLQRVRRQMEAPGAPPRTLTREAMEQIRYLRGQCAESWSVPRLAEGFDVSADVIRRVLKSKFVPTPARRLKQDQRVLGRAGPARAPPEPCSAGCSASAPSLTSGAAVPSPAQSRSPALSTRQPSAGFARAPGSPTGRRRGPLGRERPEPAALRAQEGLRPPRPGAHSPGLPGDGKPEERKPGDSGGQNFSSGAVQRGREFFDGNGNFLYRI